jgi:hypothetical protein
MSGNEDGGADDETVRRGLFYGRELANVGELRPQQAKAFALRRCGVPVERAADELGVTKSRVYNAASEVENRLDAMRETLRLVDSDEPPIPDRCAGCGDGLTEWSIDDDGRALCPDCAGL